MTENMHVDTPSVLLVDDEKEVADAYALRLQGVADVSIAYSGQEALAEVDESDPPDVVLLDRHMPGLSGDEVLQELRERGIRTRVIMVTAIDPDLKILELPFDDYLCKPVNRADIRAAVDQQCQILGYELLGVYFERESKRAVIEAELQPEERQTHDDFDALEQETRELRDRVERLLPKAGEFLSDFAGIDREGY